MRDITDEVVMKRRLEQESLQRQRQAEEYSHIFNSVFCGIVQYRMDRQGGVKFEKANLEAIRTLVIHRRNFGQKRIGIFLI